MKTLAAITLLIVLAGCGSATAKPSFEPPKGAVEVEVGVWAFENMLYGIDCARLEALTKEGEKFGPSPRQPDGSYKSGFGYVCS